MREKNYGASGARKVARIRRESSQRDLQIFGSTVKKQEATMEMFWARILRSFGSTDTLGSTDGPKLRGESRTWCLDCPHSFKSFHISQTIQTHVSQQLDYDT